MLEISRTVGLCGHTREITDWAIHWPTGVIATASWDHSVRLWRAESGECVATLLGHEFAVRSVAFSPDGKCVVSGGDDEAIRVWEIASGSQVRVIRGHNNPDFTATIWGLCISPDSQLLASAGSDNSVRLWSLATGEQRGVLPHPDIVFRVVFRKAGPQALSACADGVIRLWDVALGREKLAVAAHAGEVLCLALSPKEDLFASGGSDCTVNLWRAETGEPLLRLLGHTHTVGSVAFSPEQALLASSSENGELKLWDAATGREVVSLQASPFAVRLEFSPDGSHLLIGYANGDVNVRRAT